MMETNYQENVAAEKECVDKQKVDMFIMSNQKYFPSEKIMYLKDKLYRLDEQKFSMLSTLELKDPTTYLLISLFAGGFGVDRFMLGDTGMGVLKLLTGGCCGILSIVDWFTIQNKAKEKNFNSIMMML